MLDLADLVVIAARTLGIDSDSALSSVDIPAARAALAEAGPPGQRPGARADPAAAATAGLALVRALLRHRPFPQQNQQVAVAAGLQFLSLNGWRADLDPAETTAVVIEALASGRLTADDAATWLAPRLSSALSGSGRRRLRSVAPSPVGRAVASALLAGTVGGIAALTAACSHAPATPSVQPAGLAYAACMRSHGIREFPDPSSSGVAAIVPAAGINPNSSRFLSAEQSCQAAVPAAVIHIVTP